MTEYIILEISSFSTKKPREFDKYVNQTFRMDDMLSVGKNIELQFSKDKLKVKLESIEKEKETNTDKKFVLVCNKFVAIIQLAETFNELEQNK